MNSIILPVINGQTYIFCQIINERFVMIADEIKLLHIMINISSRN